MLQNVRVTDFTVSKILRENEQGGRVGGGDNYPHTQIRVKTSENLKLSDVFTVHRKRPLV